MLESIQKRARHHAPSALLAATQVPRHPHHAPSAQQDLTRAILRVSSCTSCPAGCLGGLHMRGVRREASSLVAWNAGAGAGAYALKSLSNATYLFAKRVLLDYFQHQPQQYTMMFHRHHHRHVENVLKALCKRCWFKKLQRMPCRLPRTRRHHHAQPAQQVGFRASISSMRRVSCGTTRTFGAEKCFICARGNMPLRVRVRHVCVAGRMPCLDEGARLAQHVLPARC